MSVIDTKPRMPVRVWHWIANTLGDFWSGFGAFMRREIVAIFRWIP